MDDTAHVHSDSAEAWSDYMVTKALQAPYARQLQMELIKVCVQKKLEFRGQGNMIQVVEDLRKWLLAGQVRLEEVTAIQEDDFQREQRAALVATQELEDSGDEDSNPGGRLPAKSQQIKRR